MALGLSSFPISLLNLWPDWDIRASGQISILLLVSYLHFHQHHSVPIANNGSAFLVGTVVLLIICRSSDYFRERSFHMAFAMALTLIGFIILATVNTITNKKLVYFACFMLTSGAFTPSCLFHSWHNNNTPSENGRAAITCFLVGAANSGGIVSALAFDSRTAPKYIPALGLGAGFQALGIVIILAFGAWFRYDNRRRDKT